MMMMMMMMMLLLFAQTQKKEKKKKKAFQLLPHIHPNSILHGINFTTLKRG
jgi:hypothetical protein